VLNLAETTIVQNAWERGQAVSLHGWIYGLDNGILKDLGVTHSKDTDLRETMHNRIKTLLKQAK